MPKVQLENKYKIQNYSFQRMKPNYPPLGARKSLLNMQRSLFDASQVPELGQSKQFLKSFLDVASSNRGYSIASLKNRPKTSNKTSFFQLDSDFPSIIFKKTSLQCWQIQITLFLLGKFKEKFKTPKNSTIAQLKRYIFSQISTQLRPELFVLALEGDILESNFILGELHRHSVSLQQIKAELIETQGIRVNNTMVEVRTGERGAAIMPCGHSFSRNRMNETINYQIMDRCCFITCQIVVKGKKCGYRWDEKEWQLVAGLSQKDMNQVCNRLSSNYIVANNLKNAKQSQQEEKFTTIASEQLLRESRTNFRSSKKPRVNVSQEQKVKIILELLDRTTESFEIDRTISIKKLKQYISSLYCPEILPNQFNLTHNRAILASISTLDSLNLEKVELKQEKVAVNTNRMKEVSLNDPELSSRSIMEMSNGFPKSEIRAYKNISLRRFHGPPKQKVTLDIQEPEYKKPVELELPEKQPRLLAFIAVVMGDSDSEDLSVGEEEEEEVQEGHLQSANLPAKTQMQLQLEQIQQQINSLKQQYLAVSTFSRAEEELLQLQAQQKLIQIQVEERKLQLERRINLLQRQELEKYEQLKKTHIKVVITLYNGTSVTFPQIENKMNIHQLKQLTNQQHPHDLLPAQTVYLFNETVAGLTATLKELTDNCTIALKERKAEVWELPNIPGSEEEDPVTCIKGRAFMSCGHGYSREGIIVNINAQLSSNQYTIKCLMEKENKTKCDFEWAHEEWRLVAGFNNAQMAEVQARLSLNWIHHTSLECKSCHIKSSIVGVKQKRVKCPNCPVADFCRICQQPWKWPGTKDCKSGSCQIRKDLVTQSSYARQFTVYQKGKKIVIKTPEWRACPRCGMAVNNYMSCKHTKCSCTTPGYSFCFICLSLCKEGKWSCGSYDNYCGFVAQRQRFD